MCNNKILKKYVEEEFKCNQNIVNPAAKNLTLIWTNKETVLVLDKLYDNVNWSSTNLVGKDLF